MAYNPETDVEKGNYYKLLEELMCAAQLVSDSADHFYDILEVSKLKHAPEYTRQLLAMEYEQLTKACRGMKEYEAKFKAQEGASTAVLAFTKAMCEDFDEAKEDYEAYFKNLAGRT